MTADEFNRRVSDDIAWMVRRNQLRYDAEMKPRREQVTCRCEAYPFPHRQDRIGYCNDFLTHENTKSCKERDGDWWEEKMLDDRHRAADINAVNSKRG